MSFGDAYFFKKTVHSYLKVHVLLCPYLFRVAFDSHLIQLKFQGNYVEKADTYFSLSEVNF